MKSKKIVAVILSLFFVLGFTCNVMGVEPAVTPSDASPSDTTNSSSSSSSSSINLNINDYDSKPIIKSITLSRSVATPGDTIKLTMETENIEGKYVEVDMGHTTNHGGMAHVFNGIIHDGILEDEFTVGGRYSYIGDYYLLGIRVTYDVRHYEDVLKHRTVLWVRDQDWFSGDEYIHLDGYDDFKFTLKNKKNDDEHDNDEKDRDHTPASWELNPNEKQQLAVSCVGLPVGTSAGYQEQGEIAKALFSASMPAGWQKAFSFNILTNGNPDYSLKDGSMTLVIPSEYQKLSVSSGQTGRQFAILAMDKTGKVYVLMDTDSNPNTITVSLNFEGYALNLIYKD